VNSQAGRLRYVKTRIADFHVTLIELLVVIAYHCHPGRHAVAWTITVSDLRQNRRHETMNGSKPRSPSGGFQTPTPKRRRQGLRVSCSPSPRPLPQGEGETFARALVIRSSLVVVRLRNERQRSGDCNRNVRIFQHRADALPLLWGEGWGEGERSKFQPQAHDDSQDCQPSRAPGKAGVSQFDYENLN
jgi:hypothetical protein